MAESTRRDGIQCSYKGETHDGALVRTGHSIEFHGPLRRLRIQRVESVDGDGAAGKKITISIMLAISFWAMAWIAFPPFQFVVLALVIAIFLAVIVLRLRKDTGWINIYGETAGGDHRKWCVRDRQRQDKSLWDFLDGIEEHP